MLEIAQCATKISFLELKFAVKKTSFQGSDKNTTPFGADNINNISAQSVEHLTLEYLTDLSRVTCS